LFAGQNGLLMLAKQSVWLVRVGMCSFYSSMVSRQGMHAIYRYDANCMVPVNSAARQVQLELERIMSSDPGNPVAWRVSQAIVISNWNVLHGRGPGPEAEGQRILERIYVR
jgi:hypothetical protein